MIFIYYFPHNFDLLTTFLVSRLTEKSSFLAYFYGLKLLLIEGGEIDELIGGLFPILPDIDPISFILKLVSGFFWAWEWSCAKWTGL